MNTLHHVFTSISVQGPIPKRMEFETWTIRQRHEFIRHRYGRKGFKIASPGDWCYLIYRAQGWAVRFKLNCKREIIATQVIDASECADLIHQSELADAAIYSKN